MQYEQVIDVTAVAIDSRRISFECPRCWSSRTKTGVPTKTAHRVFHGHGSGRNQQNRIEYRVPHCGGDNPTAWSTTPPRFYQFRIHITNDTTRCDDVTKIEKALIKKRVRESRETLLDFVHSIRGGASDDDLQIGFPCLANHSMFKKLIQLNRATPSWGPMNTAT
jgi:hypothetical protein